MKDKIAVGVAMLGLALMLFGVTVTAIDSQERQARQQEAIREGIEEVTRMVRELGVLTERLKACRVGATDAGMADER